VETDGKVGQQHLHNAVLYYQPTCRAMCCSSLAAMKN